MSFAVRKIAFILLLVIMLDSCSSLSTGKRIIKWTAFAGGIGALTTAVVLSNGDLNRMSVENPQKAIAGAGGGLLLVGILALCLDIKLFD